MCIRDRPEHLYWDSISEGELQSLTGTHLAGLVKAQACAAQKAVASLKTELAALESTVGFSRKARSPFAWKFVLLLLKCHVHIMLTRFEM